MTDGGGLKPSRVAFSGRDRAVSEGPFGNVEDLVAGYWIWKVKDLDEAVAWVKRCPNPMPGPRSSKSVRCTRWRISLDEAAVSLPPRSPRSGSRRQYPMPNQPYASERPHRFPFALNLPAHFLSRPLPQRLVSVRSGLAEGAARKLKNRAGRERSHRALLVFRHLSQAVDHLPPSALDRIRAAPEARASHAVKSTPRRPLPDQPR